MFLPTNLVCPIVIWLTAAIRWDFPYRRKSEYFPSMWFIWACNGETEIGSAIKNVKLFQIQESMKSNDQNELSELSDSENNFICLHALKLEGHRIWDESRNEYAWRPWETLELVAAVIFDFGIFSLKVILQGLASELLTEMIDCFFDKILFISPSTGITSENFFMGPVKNAQLSVKHTWVLRTPFWALSEQCFF